MLFKGDQESFEKQVRIWIQGQLRSITSGGQAGRGLEGAELVVQGKKVVPDMFFQDQQVNYSKCKQLPALCTQAYHPPGQVPL